MVKKKRKKQAGIQQSPTRQGPPETSAEDPARAQVEPPAGLTDATRTLAPASPDADEADPAPAPGEASGGALAGRRDFLALSGNLLVGVCGLGVLAGGLRMAMPDFTTGAPLRFALGLPADFKMHTLTWMRGQDVFVIHNAEGYGAFSARCTHLGCTVRRTADGFSCPCHGARFDPLGRVVAGPARTDLPWFALWSEPDGRLWVDTRVLVAPGPRSLDRLDPGAAGED